MSVVKESSKLLTNKYFFSGTRAVSKILHLLTAS